MHTAAANALRDTVLEFLARLPNYCRKQPSHFEGKWHRNHRYSSARVTPTSLSPDAEYIWS